MDRELRKLIRQIEDLGWDYDRMSSSGRATYDKIIVSLNRVIRIQSREK